jgi:hypothetical protein
VLLAEYELLQGKLKTSRRLAERSAFIAESLGLSNLRAQSLGVQAESAAALGDAQEADNLKKMAKEAITERGDDIWANAYLLAIESRLARMQPMWNQLWSLSRILEVEAASLQARNEGHPIVGILRVESAHCWVATGYVHEARRILGDLRSSRLDWRSAWECELIGLVTQDGDFDLEDELDTLIRQALASGAPYLAVAGALNVSTYCLVAGRDDQAGRIALWVARTCQARGWQLLASRAQAIVPNELSTAIALGEAVHDSEGIVSLAAPRRSQGPPPSDEAPMLPDPFDD